MVGSEKNDSRGVLQRAAHVQADSDGLDLAACFDVQARIVERRSFEQQLTFVDLELLAVRFVAAVDDAQLAATDGISPVCTVVPTRACQPALQTEGVDAHVVADRDFALRCERSCGPARSASVS